MQADASQRKLIAADPTAAIFLLDLSGCGNRKIHVHEFCDGPVWPLKEPHKRISQEWTFTKTNLRWSHILPLSPLSAHPQRSLVLEALNYHWANRDLFKASTKTSHFPCIVVFSCQLQFTVASIFCNWLVIDVVWAERERQNGSDGRGERRVTYRIVNTRPRQWKVQGHRGRRHCLVKMSWCLLWSTHSVESNIWLSCLFGFCIHLLYKSVLMKKNLEVPYII